MRNRVLSGILAVAMLFLILTEQAEARGIKPGPIHIKHLPRIYIGDSRHNMPRPGTTTTTTSTSSGSNDTATDLKYAAIAGGAAIVVVVALWTMGKMQ